MSIKILKKVRQLNILEMFLPSSKICCIAIAKSSRKRGDTFSPQERVCSRVPVRKCIWLCFGYVIEFLMLIREMAFVFHKSKQAYSRVTLKNLSEKMNSAKVSFCSK